ncbi:hypothetical protein RD792_001702 [Penstemon davidsonii]|uniref:Legumain n=1 Tax=Penstemon davidsonii TaxID=160366 RepID=A0ABR0DP39_9LAMI|nr:hypothetical protein RD792_001702 [Penstemon davidsonii]
MMLIAIFFAFAILSGAEGQNSTNTKWAVLIAGSNGYENYRHQADVCHAYQILKRGGLKDENIIVFMFDDIAYHPENPRPGVIINRPDGDDVYTGVPKDYVGEDVNAVNFFAVLLGDKTALTGGSGKVVESGPDDHIFVYYTDHGAAGVLGAEGQNSTNTKWAVLIAGSNGYENYRHQADVCHAYQILKRGGLKDENIIVFMFDDIAYHPENPRPGVIINRPDGDDVYTGVPKDYVGEDVNAVNFFAVLLGDKTALTGGSGKVVESGPDDHIFVYYTDHGAAGVLGLPNEGIIYANDLNDVLKQKHASGSYKSLVFYLEACESGSIFEGLLPEGLSIYATTASNSSESSFGMYCPGDHPSPPQEYTT